DMSTRAKEMLETFEERSVFVVAVDALSAGAGATGAVTESEDNAGGTTRSIAAAAVEIMTFDISSAQKRSRTSADEYDTPADYICSSNDLKTLCQVIKAAGNGEGATALKGGTVIETVFAPTDDAFDRDSKTVASRLNLKDFSDIYTSPTEADRLLRYLIVPNQALLSSAFKSGAEYQNLMKKDLQYETA
ncbi:hypothetical protein Vretifemale_3172, partial [Volvox reticuliferus]